MASEMRTPEFDKDDNGYCAVRLCDGTTLLWSVEEGVLFHKVTPDSTPITIDADSIINDVISTAVLAKGDAVFYQEQYNEMTRRWQKQNKLLHMVRQHYGVEDIEALFAEGKQTEAPIMVRMGEIEMRVTGNIDETLEKLNNMNNLLEQIVPKFGDLERMDQVVHGAVECLSERLADMVANDGPPISINTYKDVEVYYSIEAGEEIEVAGKKVQVRNILKVEPHKGLLLVTFEGSEV